MRITAILHHAEGTIGTIATILARRGLEASFRHPHRGEPLPDPAGVDAAIVMGGKASANCGTSWMEAETAWVAQLCALDVPMLGICLGAQILARALGATVSRHPLGIEERGYSEVRPAIAGMPRTVFQFHEEGFGLPAGADLLAAGDAFPVQAFAWRRAVGLQFHPEMTGPILRDWTRRPDLDLARGCPIRRAGDLDALMRHQGAVDHWLDGFVASRILGGRTPDRRPQRTMGRMALAHRDHVPEPVPGRA